MKELQPSHRPGKISASAAGAGVPSPKDLEKRARELSLIAGRAASDFTEADLEQARRELLGIATNPADEDAMVSAVTTWDEVPGSTGTQKPNFGPSDEATVAERLVEEGVAEALHDEMVEARKKNVDSAS
jgi:hypothetical protein